MQSENNRKTANLTVIPLQLADSDETDVFDFGGAVRRINITGIRVDETFANLVTFASQLNGLITGDQSTRTAFVSDLLGTIQVKIEDVDFEFIAGRPTLLFWTIRLIEASSRG